MGADRDVDVARLAEKLDEMARTYPGQPIPTFTRQHHERVAAALMPVVDAIARQRAAEELEAAAAAARGMHDPPAPDCVEWADWLDARAAALRGPHA